MFKFGGMNLVVRVNGRVAFLIQKSEQLTLEDVQLMSHLCTHIALVNDTL